MGRGSGGQSPPEPDASSSSIRRAVLLRHARALVGLSLAEIADGQGLGAPLSRVHTKGWSGQLIERELGHGGSDGPGPDFASLGIELKTVPVTPALLPLESTAVCHIDPVAIAAESWAASTAREKLTKVLFVALEVTDRKAPVGERRVSFVHLWQPDAAEEGILAADFAMFVREYFLPGRASQISGHLGVALQVRPKGRNAADRRLAYGERGQPIRIGRMGFYLRPAFVGQILRRGLAAASG